VPRKVVILDEIPKGATGKLQRIGLAEKLGLCRRPEGRDTGGARRPGEMKICIFGAGAIGGYMGAKLAQAGADVSLVARGPHLAAMKENGLRLIEGTRRRTVAVTASDNPADLGPQDYVIVTLKAHSVPPVVEKMQPLIGPDTTIVSGVNGVPWWYFHKIGGRWRARGWPRSIRATRSGTASGRTACWAAWSIRRRR
jgi:pyrroline-5-carboxylate reductase